MGMLYEITKNLTKEKHKEIMIKQLLELGVYGDGGVSLYDIDYTKAEAKQHLESNRHHYSSKAHTFAMTAWRAPKMERLMKILETFDWDKLEVRNDR